MKIGPFEKSIEGILWEKEPIGISAEDVPSLVPGDEPPESLLNELFPTSGMNEELTKFLQPPVKNRQILNPANFFHMALEIPDRLRQASAAIKSAKSKTAILRAADIMEDQKISMAMLDAYRRLLVPG